MSGRFFRHDVSWADYQSAFSILQAPPGIAPPEAAYNIAPGQIVPILRHLPDRPGRAPIGELAPALWGLVPSWWKKPLSEKNFETFKARCETVAESNTFRGAFRHHRCLVPASGFYEWSGPRGRRQPFAAGLRNRRWFCFAGLWDRAMIDGSEIDTFAILTTRPNDVMAGISTRMPVILRPEDYARWLDVEERRVSDLFAPFPAADMHAWPVGPDVGNVRNQGPELAQEV
ncbi:SOS response-associated peptidase [Henriciella aquimarina]|uniref:SOS response-associated peptidase n=1 Tax=Henriciella aquimarina TaxID=545261 RepID=UPI000A06908D|nr:SOS response-associated peptidase [Henriciella aquimarina]